MSGHRRDVHTIAPFSVDIRSDGRPSDCHELEPASSEASPRTLTDDALIRDALTLFREKRQDEIPVVDAQGRPAGLLDVQDLIALKLVRD